MNRLMNKKMLPINTIIFTVSAFLFNALNTAQATENWNGTVLGFEAPQTGLLEDILGARSYLADNGFHFNLGYLNQMAYNGHGGYNKDSHVAYIDQFSFTFTQNLETLTGIADAKIEGNIVNRNHNDLLTSKRLQDPRVGGNDSSQESHGGGSITRLGWLTFSRSFLDRRLHWRIGMMNKTQDFDQIIPCDFLLRTQCGGKSANSLTWYNWNVHYWGTAIQYKITPELTFKTGVYEQNSQAPSRRQAWNTSMRGARGFLLPVEVELKTYISELAGIYNLGVLYTNSEQTDLYRGESMDAGVLDPQGYQKYNNTWFMYAGFNQQITQRGSDAHRGMSLSGSMSLADQRSNPNHYTAALSLRYRGIFDVRPDDWVGIGVSYIKGSDHYKRGQKLNNEISGIHDYNNPFYSPVPTHSVNTEFFYRIKAFSWLELQPGLQYWHRPGAIAETTDAWVATFKTVVTF